LESAPLGECHAPGTAALIELIRVLDGFNRCRFRGDRKLQGEGDIARKRLRLAPVEAVEPEV
jgi:hypothetical protein